MATGHRALGRGPEHDRQRPLRPVLLDPHLLLRRRRHPHHAARPGPPSADASRITGFCCCHPHAVPSLAYWPVKCAELVRAPTLTERCTARRPPRAGPTLVQTAKPPILGRHSETRCRARAPAPVRLCPPPADAARHAAAPPRARSPTQSNPFCAAAANNPCRRAVRRAIPGDAGLPAARLAEVRKTPSWPRSWANCSFS